MRAWILPGIVICTKCRFLMPVKESFNDARKLKGPYAIYLCGNHRCSNFEREVKVPLQQVGK